LLFQQPGFSAAKTGTVVADEIVRLVRISPDREWAYVRSEAGAEGWLWAALLMTFTPKLDAIPRQDFAAEPPGAFQNEQVDTKKESKPDPEPEKSRDQVERRRGIPRELMDEVEAELAEDYDDDEPAYGGAADESLLEEAPPPRESTTELEAPLDDLVGALPSLEEAAEKSKREEATPPPPPKPAPIAPPAPPPPPTLGSTPPPQPEPSTSTAVPVPKPQPGPAEVAQPADKTVQLSAYYPKEAAPNVWLPLRAYIYRAIAAPQVADDAKQFMGDAVSSFRRAEDTARTEVQEGALVTATPELPGFQVNPPSISVLFLEDWHRFEFKLRATTAPLEQAANGHITFAIEGIIIADIPLSMFVSASATSPIPAGLSSNPTSMPTNLTSTTTKPYQSIFCSYSHKDTWIVERVEKAYKALGMDFLRDVVKLKSGQDWNAELLNMIDRADIFQLFWSSNAMQSKYVQQEWEYALKRGTGRVSFIRPVYWEDPMPNVPPELGHIHFAFQPELDD
jgi:hypothetical protein